MHWTQFNSFKSQNFADIRKKEILIQCDNIRLSVLKNVRLSDDSVCVTKQRQRFELTKQKMMTNEQIN